MEPPLTLIETEVKWPRFENIASVPDETVIIFNLVNQLINDSEEKKYFMVMS